MIDGFFILIFTSISCSMLGVFLILRRLSMLTDAISHTVLLGIVISYLFVHDLSSPFLIVGATIMGLLTVFFVESLGNSKFVKYNDAIGIVFPILFSLAVIIISKYFRNVHLDTDIVLVGEVLFSSIDTMKIFGYNISKVLIQSALLVLIILSFIIFNFKKLKISTFNEEYARLLGINVTLLFYSLMSLTSLTAVVSFNSVGAILVISFFIAPAASALLFSKSLKETLLISILISIFNCVLSCILSIWFNVSISGMSAFINALVFIILLVYKKERNKNVY